MADHNFIDYYRRHFETLGVPLLPDHALPESELAAAEQRLGIRAPAALRDYYRVAGREQRLNAAHNRLLPAAEWFVDAGRLVFLDENQSVVVWGTPVAIADGDDDPAVHQGVNDDTIEWHEEHEHVSVFLATHLHWQASWGGLPYCAQGPAGPRSRATLDRDWTFVGEANRLRAYSRPGRAACLVPWDDAERVFAGATSAAGLDETGRAIGVVWE